MRRQTTQALAANPILIGAVTLLVTVVAVFLAYNANNGLPFVPTFQLNVEAPQAHRLTVGNEVREGGYRIGQISEIETARGENGETVALMQLSLDEVASPVPVDSKIIIRPRSALGLKYIDFIRGDANEYFPEGAVLEADADVAPPELDQFFDMFDEPTRQYSRRNLVTFGGGLAARGVAINRTLATLPELLRDVVPVFQTLSDPDTGLAEFFDELEDAGRVTAPVAQEFARGFTLMAQTFEAFSRFPNALEQTIEDSPETLLVGIDSFEDQLPFLRQLSDVSDELRGTAAVVRTSVPTINRALAVGTDVLPRTVQINEDFALALDALGDLVADPTTNQTLTGLLSTVSTLKPTLRWVGPHITVCNYFNYFWTLLSDHLGEFNDTGTIQRIQAKSVPRQDDGLTQFGATEPVNGGQVNPIERALLGAPAHLHAQAYGRAVDEKGRADCESGQRGYPERIAEGMPEGFEIAVDPRTPGLQGTTFTGRARVPRGQTFSAEPAGDAPILEVTPVAPEVDE